MINARGFFQLEPRTVINRIDLAALLGVSIEDLEAANRDGALRSVEIGFHTFYRGEWVLEWLEGLALRPGRDERALESLALQDKPVWEPFATAPKNGEPFLACWLGRVTLAWWNAEVKGWQEYPDGDFANCEEISHWMPLPVSPLTPGEGMARAHRSREHEDDIRIPVSFAKE